MNKLYSYKLTITTRPQLATIVNFKCTKKNRNRQYHRPSWCNLMDVMDTTTRWIWEDEEYELYQRNERQILNIP